jgi:hypothetical protein
VFGDLDRLFESLEQFFIASIAFALDQLFLCNTVRSFDVRIALQSVRSSASLYCSLRLSGEKAWLQSSSGKGFPYH